MVDAQEFDSKVTYSRVELDHLGRVTKTERYYDVDDDESFPTDGTVDNGDRLLARAEQLYDKLGARLPQQDALRSIPRTARWAARW